MVPVADGTEEMEAVIVIDVLRRAGAEVAVASVEKELQVVASRGVKLVADALVQDLSDTPFDLIALPVMTVGFCIDYYAIVRIIGLISFLF